MGLLRRAKPPAPEAGPLVEGPGAVGAPESYHPDGQWATLKNEVHLLLAAQAPQLPNAADEADLQPLTCELLSRAAADLGLSLTASQQQELAAQVSREFLGLGPIDRLVQDDSITEVMVNGPRQVYVERFGKLYETPVTFLDDAHVIRIIRKIITPLGRHIDESSPMVDGRLPDGSRVNAVIPPLAIDGPTINIRKFSADPYTVEDLIRFGTLTSELAQFLKACVWGRLNIVVSGGTGTGKTTLLNVLSSFIPEGERILTIEDAAELKLQQRHVVRLEARPPDAAGKGQITIRQLVINALRMRPDRIVVGEVRGGEALDMLQAMTTGHDGSLTTVHSSSPRDTLRRLETMALMAGMELPLRAVREQIAAAIDLIAHLQRLADGSRRVVQVTEVQGMEGDTIVTQDIFTFRAEPGLKGILGGKLVPTGMRPRFMGKLELAGASLPPTIFGHAEH